MTTRPPATVSADCARFEAQLGAWLEHDLGATDQGWMLTHRSTCATCDALVADLERLTAQAAALPSLSPSRDLWSGIEARLEAPVVPLSPSTTGAPPASRAGRGISVQWFAMAATVLVAVSSGITWQLAKARRGDAVAASVAARASSGEPLSADGGLPGATAELAVGTSASVLPALTGSSTATGLPGDAATNARLVVADETDAADPHFTYEREIGALRQIVDERFTELDSVTVTELRRNLDIIDRAIADSRAALARDPRSGVVSSQLDRALQAKLTLLRRVALL